MTKKTTSLSPTKKLIQAFSDFLIGFSIFLIIAGLIGTAFVIQDLQDNTSQDVRSDASTETTELIPDPDITCDTMPVCTDPIAATGVLDSCVAEEICEIPPGCYYEDINCVTSPCPMAPGVVICPEKIDDIFFSDPTGLDSPTYSLDEEGKAIVPESELKAGQNYYFSVPVQLQNILKDPMTGSTPFFFLGLTSNVRQYTADLISYPMIVNHRDGFNSTLKGSFVAEAQNTFEYTIRTIDPQGSVIIAETNYENNTHVHTFEAQKCSNNPDLNADDKVDLRDFSILSREFLSRRSTFTADINCDNSVDMRDYSIMASHFTVAQ